jgi:hypothetical protein
MTGKMLCIIGKFEKLVKVRWVPLDSGTVNDKRILAPTFSSAAIIITFASSVGSIKISDQQYLLGCSLEERPEITVFAFNPIL